MPLDFSPLRDLARSHYESAALKQKSIYDDMLRQRQQQDEMAKLAKQHEYSKELLTSRLGSAESVADKKLQLQNAQYTIRNALADKKYNQADRKMLLDAYKGIGMKFVDLGDGDSANRIFSEVQSLSGVPVEQPSAEFPVQNRLPIDRPSEAFNVGGAAPVMSTGPSVPQQPVARTRFDVIGDVGAFNKAADKKSQMKLMNNKVYQAGRTFDLPEDMSEWTPEQFDRASKKVQEERLAAAAASGAAAADVRRQTEALQQQTKLMSAEAIVDEIAQKYPSVVNAKTGTGALFQSVLVKAERLTGIGQNVREYDSTVEGFAGQMAKAFGGDSGQLSNQDKADVKYMAPKEGDDVTTASNKMNTLRRVLSKAAAAQQHFASGNLNETERIKMGMKYFRDALSEAKKEQASTGQDKWAGKPRPPQTAIDDLVKNSKGQYNPAQAEEELMRRKYGQ